MFSKNLKLLRVSFNLSQKKIAELLYVSQQTIGKWETDKATPNPDMLITLANFFNVSVDYLIGNSTVISNSNHIKENCCSLSKGEQTLIQGFRNLNINGKKKVAEYLEDISCISKFSCEATRGTSNTTDLIQSNTE